ncbi:MAG: hypothetical protein R3D57_04285 [Hyphomicrobiaceae bacterium]
MRADRERALMRLVWVERIKRWGIAVAAAAIIFGAYVFLTYERTSLIDKTIETATLDGTVVSADRSLSRRGGFTVHVRLDDGQEVDAVSFLAFMPAPGAHAEVRMARHQSGLITYDVSKVDQ